MGDIQTDQGESLELQYVPATEFQRLLRATSDAVARTRAFAALGRINTLYMIAGAWSGHIGTSFSSLEIMSWLFLNELRDLDKGPDACDLFFSSKGHDAPALYNVLIGLGLLPADKLHQLRRLHGLPGHPHVETPFIQANTGSLGMGISKAKGFVLANRLQGRTGEVYVLTGDGELQEGQFWESLGSAANQGRRRALLPSTRGPRLLPPAPRSGEASTTPVRTAPTARRRSGTRARRDRPTGRARRRGPPRRP